MNELWGIMILVGIAFGAVNGTMGAVTEQALVSAREAVTLALTMAGVMAFWMGMMEIAEQSGLIRRLSEKLAPVLDFLFPGLPAGHPARPFMAANLIANVFGLGWAATPAGLAAIKELKGGGAGGGGGHSFRESPQGFSGEGECASDTMCDFLILNISSLQLIPVNIIAYRSQYGSENPAAIIGPAILATLCSTGAAVLFIRLRFLFRGREGA